LSFISQNKIFGRLKQIFEVESPNSIDVVDSKIQPIWNAVEPFIQSVVFGGREEFGVPPINNRVVIPILNRAVQSTAPAVNTDLVDFVVVDRIWYKITNSDAVEVRTVSLKLRANVIIANKVADIDLFSEDIVIQASETVTGSVKPDFFLPVLQRNLRTQIPSRINNVEVVFDAAGAGGGTVTVLLTSTGKINWSFDGKKEQNDDLVESVV